MVEVIEGSFISTVLSVCFVSAFAIHVWLIFFGLLKRQAREDSQELPSPPTLSVL